MEENIKLPSVPNLPEDEIFALCSYNEAMKRFIDWAELHRIEIEQKGKSINE
jgi:hypothetical protein